MRQPVRVRWGGTPVGAVLGLVAAGWLAGCAGYQLGSTLPPGVKTVAVPTFVNATDHPELEAETTKAAIAEVQKDGTLRVVSADAADAVLEVRLTRYALVPTLYRNDARTTAREYRLELTADLIFRRQASKQAMMESRGIIGYATFVADVDLPSAERMALPDAAKDLAHNLVKRIVEYW